MIHPTALVHPQARLDGSVRVGPYAVIDEAVELGPGCIIGPHVYLTGRTKIGANNQFFAGCVIGEAPQDLKYRNQPTGLRIGDDNVFREHVTVHRSNTVEEDTIIGSHNFLMQHCHVAHNVTMADQVILAGGALLAGHAKVAERAFISGNCLVHQFVSIGQLSLMQGGSAISKDLPPFTVARGHNGICGLNTIGLRRAGIGAGERLQLRQLYHALFRQGLKLNAALAAARKQFKGPSAKVMLDFVAGSKRGVCSDTGQRGEAEASE